jgi:hypothetical protein
MSRRCTRSPVLAPSDSVCLRDHPARQPPARAGSRERRRELTRESSRGHTRSFTRSRACPQGDRVAHARGVERLREGRREISRGHSRVFARESRRATSVFEGPSEGTRWTSRGHASAFAKGVEMHRVRPRCRREVCPENPRDHSRHAAGAVTSCAGASRPRRQRCSVTWSAPGPVAVDYRLPPTRIESPAPKQRP